MTITATTARVLTTAADLLAAHRPDDPAGELDLQMALTAAARAAVGYDRAAIERAATSASNAVPVFDGRTRAQLAELLRTAAADVLHVDGPGAPVRIVRSGDDGRVQVEPVRYEGPRADNGWRPAGWRGYRPAYWTLRDGLTPVA